MKSFEIFDSKNTPIGDFLLQERNLTMKKVMFHPVARNNEDRLEKRLVRVRQWVESDMNF